MGAQSLASQLKEKRAEMIISELEAVALRLFDERGFGEVIKGGGHTWRGTPRRVPGRHCGQDDHLDQRQRDHLELLPRPSAYGPHRLTARNG